MENEGLQYEDHIQLIETIVSMKKGKFNFANVDPEDMAQDIRVICWESLQKFDKEKVGKSIFHFVARCVDNALYNKFRGVYLDNNPPCLRCEHYIKKTKSCAIEEVGCDRIVAYRQRMARKRAIAAPLSYNAQMDATDGQDFTQNACLSVGSTTGVCDLDDTLRSESDANLVKFYDQMKEGVEVPQHYQRMIQRQVRSIMEDNDD